MDADWDLHSVLELCCSKLSPEAELPTLGDEGLAGHLDWLDEKVDLSAWADLDFPDDLPPAVMTEAGHPPAADYHLPRISFEQPKPEDSWQSVVEVAYLRTPEYLSPPDSPSTPVAIVPNVDIFLNLSPEPSVSSADASSPEGFPDDVSDRPDVVENDALVVAAVNESAPLSPPRTPSSAQTYSYPASPQDADETESTGIAESFPEIISGDLAVPSTSFEVDHDEDAMDGDFDPEGSASDSEDEPKSRRPGPRRSRTKKPPQRRKRKAADPGSRRERKRLQNKDAATRYRRKKKQEYDIVEEEYQELSRINDGLKAEATRVGNEVSYLKGLMRELFQAKGLLPQGR